MKIILMFGKDISSEARVGKAALFTGTARKEQEVLLCCPSRVTRRQILILQRATQNYF